MSRTNAAERQGDAGGKSRSTATALARKRLIAGAVIDILASEGARSLTHRRIDAHLGLPQGATSYYYPRRFDLLKAGFNRLFDDGFEEFLHCYGPVIRRLEAGEALDVDLVAESAYRHWKAVTQPSGRDMAIARFEFYLLATHDPKLLAVQNERRRTMFELTAKIFAGLGSSNPKRASSEFSSRVQGDYISHFIAPSFSRATLTAADFAARIRQLVDESASAKIDRTHGADQASLIAM